MEEEEKKGVKEMHLTYLYPAKSFLNALFDFTDAK